MLLKALGFVAAATLAAPLAAQQVTRKFDYKPVANIQEISLAIDKVKINQIVFRGGKEDKGALRRSAAECVVRVDNDGQVPVAVGVAVVLLDGDGNIVAAGSGGTRVGWLSAGERDTSAIRFPFVYRNFDKAKTFLVTMEVEPKPMKEEKPAAVPAPAATPAP
jgi:hypothetical protein